MLHTLACLSQRFHRHDKQFHSIQFWDILFQVWKKKKSENKGSSDIKITLFFLFATAEAASGHCCHLPSSEPPNRHLPQRCPTTARVHQSPALLFHTRIMDLTVPHNLPYLILQHPIFSLFSAAPHFSFSYPISYSLDAVQTSADLKCPCNVLLIL